MGGCVGFISNEYVCSSMNWESLFVRAAAYETTETEITEALRAHRGDDA